MGYIDIYYVRTHEQLSPFKGKIMKIIPIIINLIILLLILACPAAENNMLQSPVDGVTIQKNNNPILPQENITIIEGRAVVLGAKLSPDGVQGGIHWQSSNGEIAELSSLTGSEITVTGKNGGTTIIFVTARNTFNDLEVQTECSVTVISKSFFKWNYRYLEWIEAPALEPLTNTYFYDAGFPVLIRTGETQIYSDMHRSGIVLEGKGSQLIIGSGMTTPTNSPFSDHPVFDKNGQFDFFNGPKNYPYWLGRVRISAEYEILDPDPNKSLLRIQVNNNTSDRSGASAINNSLVTELSPASPRAGILTGIFDKSLSALIKNGITLTEVLSNSFVCLTLPDGKILIRGIRIESAD